MHRLPATTNRVPSPVLVLRDTVRVGDEVASIVFGAGAVWLANGGANSVPRIDPLTRGLTSFPRVDPSRMWRSTGTQVPCGCCSRPSHNVM